MTSHRYAACLLVLAALAAGSCERSDGPQGGAGATICFAFQDLETEFWVAAHKAITETLKQRGLRVIERNAHQDANKQLEQVRDAIADHVDGIILIPQDGESALAIIGEANAAGVPIAVFNRPPADRSRPALVVVADNRKIARDTVAYLVTEAEQRAAALKRKLTPLIMVGDLGDNNAIDRKKGFYDAVAARPDLFHEPIEVPTKWDAPTALARLENALDGHPQVDLIFTSSDFLYPQIQAALQPRGRWKARGQEGHVILGGLDGDRTAYRLMQAGYVDATGVQDVFFEAEALLDALLAAIAAGQATPGTWISDPGFALTQANLAARAKDMWGARLEMEAAGASPP